jgi:hypothetical protein
MRERTPTPWQIYSDADPYHVQIKGIHPGTGGAHVADVLFPANAAFIVKAVNCHDALVGALQLIAGMSDDSFARNVAENILTARGLPIKESA